MTPPRARGRAVALAIALLAATSIVAAQAPATHPAADADVDSDVEAHDDAPRGPPDIPRREPPDYDGRPEPGVDATEALLWIPRVIFWPVHAIFEYVLRRPIGWLLTTGERERWDPFQVQPLSQSAPSWGLVPTVLYDLGFLPSIGAYVWLADAITRGDDLRFQVGFWGIDWLRGVVLDRVALDDRSDVEVRFEASARPDYLFVGIGGIARPEIQSRFGRRFLDAAIGAEHRPWRASRLAFEVGVSANELYDTDYRGSAEERTISDAIAQGWYPNLSTFPPGFEGYTAYTQRLEAALDTREAVPSDGSGARIEAHAELGVDLPHALDRRWLLWGGAAGAYWDIDSGRTLGLSAMAELATPLGPDAIPFTELPDLGDRGPMAGFRRGWLIGESVTAAVLDYRYPIWVAMEGFASIAVGNAFGESFAGFAPGKLRTSYILGLRTVGDPDQSFLFQLGFGTATFDEGLDPAILRLTAGMQEGF